MALHKMLKECGVATQRGETANWLARNRSVRPFDMVVTIDYKRHGYDVGIADATRLGKDRSVPYFQAGKAADLLLKEKQRDYQKKITEYGPLIKEVQFSPVIFEAAGGFGAKAQQLFGEWQKLALEHAKATGRSPNYRHRGGCPHTWNAMRFTAMYTQMLSFTIVKFSAFGVLRAIERASAAALQAANSA